MRSYAFFHIGDIYSVLLTHDTKPCILVENAFMKN